MRMTPLICSIPLLFALSGEVNAAEKMDDAKLTSIVAKRLHGDRTDACLAVAVIDKSVSRSFVCADPKISPRIDKNSAFEIGSISKTMTATLLAGMIEEGKVSLDTPLADLLPPGAKVPKFEDQAIKLRHIVTHTSGLPALPPGIAITNLADPYAAMDQASVLDALAKTTLTRAPGKQFEYSNFAMMLLSSAIAQREATDLETLFVDRIFKPIGMSGAYIAKPPKGIRAVKGHMSTGQETAAWTFDTNLAGVGGVRATLEDLVRYVQASLNPSDTSLGKALTLTQKPVDTASQPKMAMNWMLAPLNQNTLHTHEGGTGGFSSLVAFDTKGKRGVIILSDTALTHLGGLSNLAMHLLDPSLPLDKPRVASVAPKALIDSLQGKFQLAGAMKMDVSISGNALVVQAEGQPAFNMGYDSSGSFYPLLFDALLVPGAESAGKRDFVWMQGGGEIPAMRISEASVQTTPALSPATLKAYVGEYPLTPDFSLKIAISGDQLTVQGTGQSAIELAPDGKDKFKADSVGVRLHFERSTDDAIIAVRLLQGGNDLRGEKR